MLLLTNSFLHLAPLCSSAAIVTSNYSKYTHDGVSTIIDTPHMEQATKIDCTIDNSSTDDLNAAIPDKISSSLSLCKIHIRPLLTNNEASKCRDLAIQYAEETKCWDGGKLDGTQHTSYNTVDFPLIDYDTLEESGEIVPANNQLAQYLEEIEFTGRVFEYLEEAFGIPADELDYEDLFCVQYVAKSDDKSGRGMDSLELHRDGSLFSFTVLLSEADSFSGGGTIFDCMKGENILIDNEKFLMKDGAITARNAGDCVLHSGKLLHGGQTVTEGRRIVIVGFVDVPEYYQTEGILSKSTQQWGRIDVLNKRIARQIKKSTEGGGYRVNNKKWLPSSQSVYHGWYPFNKSLNQVSEIQRKLRLDAEGELVREILLKEEFRDSLSSFNGDITEVGDKDDFNFDNLA